MSSLKQSRTPAGGGNLELAAVWGAITVVVLAGLFTWIPLHVAASIDTGQDAGRDAPAANPFRLLIEVVTGGQPWTRTATVVAVLELAVLLVLVALPTGLLLQRRRGRRRTDRAASRMGRGSQIRATSRRAVQDTATRLGVTGEPGLLVARTVSGRQPIFQDWESVSVDVWGPRAGKSSARAVPAIMAAPGAVVATSNKRDLVDATRDPRAAVGPVWVFDPQRLVEEPVSWWWNPLTYVVDETRAQALAEVFAAAVRKPNARTDAYFDAAALELLAHLLLAAAVAGRPLTQVYLWLTDPNDDQPAQLLEETGYPLPAAAVRGYVGQPDKQRAGVYGTAQQVCAFMTNREAMAWVTRNGGREFDVDAFVRDGGTMYSLSREGRGNAAPIVTALTVAVCEAAEEYAATLPGGRLAVPMVAVLDEAANVCRWPALPDLYSHYGSRGITLLTFLQSWSQGVEAWGREGMRKLWSAANVKVYGGGVSEVEFLDELSRLIGDYRHTSASTSYSRLGGRTVSNQHQIDRILDVADLAALDRGRVVVFASGAVPTLATTQPWWEGPHRTAIAASIARHTTAPHNGATTIAPTPVSTGDRRNPWLT